MTKLSMVIFNISILKILFNTVIGRFVVSNGVLPSSSRSRRFTALIHQVKVIIYEVSGITSRVSIIMDEVPNPLIPANPYINNRQ